MNSGDEDEMARMDKYFQVFNDFILNYHNDLSSEDLGIVKQWEAFKKVIEKSPYSLQAHQQYLASKFGSQAVPTKKKSTKSVQNSKLAKDILKEMKKTNNEITKLFDKK